jgi:hypothetical protein
VSCGILDLASTCLLLLSLPARFDLDVLACCVFFLRGPFGDRVTEEEYARRTKWIIFGGTAILIMCLALTWLVQPTQYVMRDALRWRTYQSELSPDQANRLDKLMDDIQTEQRAVEEKKNK